VSEVAGIKTLEEVINLLLPLLASNFKPTKNQMQSLLLKDCLNGWS